MSRSSNSNINIKGGPVMNMEKGRRACSDSIVTLAFTVEQNR
jgi:hypothetical protein